jgi:hypothetical protein
MHLFSLLFLISLALFYGKCLNPIQLLGPNDSVYMYYGNNTYNAMFVSFVTTFNCSETPLYTYNQTSDQNKINQSYQIIF